MQLQCNLKFPENRTVLNPSVFLLITRDQQMKNKVLVMQFLARLSHIMSSSRGLAANIYQLFNNSLLVQPWSIVANGICNEADLRALSNLERLLSGSMIIMVIFKSHVKPEESW